MREWDEGCTNAKKMSPHADKTVIPMKNRRPVLLRFRGACLFVVSLCILPSLKLPNRRYFATEMASLTRFRINDADGLLLVNRRYCRQA